MPTATIFFIIAVFVSSLYWLVLFIKLSRFKSTTSYVKNSGLSILIAAKNEAKNLQQNIPNWLSQTPKPKEIILIDDFSQDQTSEIIKSFNKQGIKYLSASKDTKGKKTALSEGIAASNESVILLTDADCKANSPYWANIMNAHINDNNKIALGYGPMIKTHGFLNKFIRFETILVAIQYFGFTLLGKPYMAVGRNLAFAKSIFFDNKGYDSHLNVASGDDDLFIRDVATKSNTAIVLDPDSFVYSDAPDSLRNYIRQKTRHLSTAKHYKFHIQVLLSIHPVFYLSACFLSIYLLLQGAFLIVASAWLFRWLLLIHCGNKIFSHLDGKDLLFYIPILDLCWLPHYLYFTLPSFKKSSNHWN